MHIGKSASIGVDLPKVLRHAALMSSKLAEAGLVMTAYGAVPCQPPPQSPYVSGAACSGEGGGSTGTRSLRSGSHGGADALGGSDPSGGGGGPPERPPPQGGFGPSRPASVKCPRCCQWQVLFEWNITMQRFECRACALVAQDQLQPDLEERRAGMGVAPRLLVEAVPSVQSIQPGLAVRLPTVDWAAPEALSAQVAGPSGLRGRTLLPARWDAVTDKDEAGNTWLMAPAGCYTRTGNADSAQFFSRDKVQRKVRWA